MPQHKRGPWSATEDQYLLHLVQVMEIFLTLRLEGEPSERSDADAVLESKWRKLALAIRELTQIALPDHVCAFSANVWC